MNPNDSVLSWYDGGPALKAGVMKKLMIATMTVAIAAGGVALPVAASASGAHASAVEHKKHPKHGVQHHPCSGSVIGIDLAVGPQNICIPL